MRKRYKYKQNGVYDLLITLICALVIGWFFLYFLPEIYYENTGKSVFPPEPEAMIIEPAVMSTDMIALAAEAEEEVIVDSEPTYKAMTLEVAAYAPLDNKSGMCADSSPNVTASGTRPGMGTIAVDASKIPFGTKMYVPYYGWGIASDTGQIIREKGNLIEVFMPTYEDAMAWGRQENVTVFIEMEAENE